MDGWSSFCHIAVFCVSSVQRPVAFCHLDSEPCLATDHRMKRNKRLGLIDWFIHLSRLGHTPRSASTSSGSSTSSMWWLLVCNLDGDAFTCQKERRLISFLNRPDQSQCVWPIQPTINQSLLEVLLGKQCTFMVSICNDSSVLILVLYYDGSSYFLEVVVYLLPL